MKDLWILGWKRKYLLRVVFRYHKFIITITISFGYLFEEKLIKALLFGSKLDKSFIAMISYLCSH